MYHRYEFYICHSDRTWTTCHFIDVSEEEVHNWDGNIDAMAFDLYKQENSKADIVFMGIAHVENINEEEYSQNEE